MSKKSLIDIASLRVNKPRSPSVSIDCAAPISPFSPATPYGADYGISPSSTALANDDDSAAQIMDQPYLAPPGHKPELRPAQRSTLFSASDLLLCLSHQEDNKIETVLSQNGYKLIGKISDTLQGAIYEAGIIDTDNILKAGCKHVAIKQTCKKLYKKGEAEQDGFSYIVEEDIVKEASILKYLTTDNRTSPLYIPRFVEWFETEDDFYLVMEYAGDCTLAEFVVKAHEYIGKKLLALSEYKKVVKFLFWQIAATVEYMHSMGVCHLDLNLENILVRDGLFNFVQNTGSVAINPNICIKVADFGLAEVFHPESASHNVEKWGLRSSFTTTAPNVYAELPFDGKKADIWSIGQIFYQLLTGQVLYNIPDEEADEGYHVIYHRKLQIHLQTLRLTKYFGKKSLSLLLCMLKVHEQKRINAMDILKSPWFASYYARYASVIVKRNKLTEISRSSVNYTESSLPYYM